MLKEKCPELEKAVLVLEELSEDEKTRLLAEAREKQRRDINARIRTAELNGIELGKVEEKTEIAKKLIEIQMNIDEISKITGLTKNEIEKLMI